MLDDVDATSFALQTRLSIYRRTLDILEEQRAHFGPFTPPHIRHQLDETRRQIAQIKQELRALDRAIDDLPADIESAALPGLAGNERDLLQTYRRMLAEQVRYVALAGLSERAGPGLELADLYVERPLIPLRVHATSDRAPEAGLPAGPTLAAVLGAGPARIILEGALGSGKSTALYRLALACVTDAALGNEPAAGPLQGGLDPPLPILLSTRDLVTVLRQGNALPFNPPQPAPPAFWAAITAWLRYSDLDAFVPTIQHMLQAGRCLVCIDGIDDLEDAGLRHAIVVALGRFVARYPDNRYIVTCRTCDPPLLIQLASFEHYALGPLDAAQAEAMVTRWYAAIGPAFRRLTPDEQAERAAVLRGLLRGDPRLRALASHPLALALCILTHAEGQPLPAARGRVIQRLIDLLLNRWEQMRAGGDPTPAPDRDLFVALDHVYALLQPLALAFHARAEPGDSRPVAIGTAELETLLRAPLDALGLTQEPLERVVARLLAWWCRAGLLAPAGLAYTMPWEAVREYLAARALAQRPDFAFHAYELRHERRWHEPLLLAVGQLGRGAYPQRARLLLRHLLEPPGGADAGDQRDLLLAAECLRELGTRPGPEQAIRAEVRERLAALQEDSACPAVERIQAGLLLGHLSDRRFGALLPPLVYIAAGTFILGCRTGYDDEGPEQLAHVPAFAIGAYPITNGEYARFLRDRPGHPRPHYWYDPRYNNPAQPVVGVTWHDATAYCAWLTARLAEARWLPPKMVMRLPTEIEWEKAASWDADRQVKRQYPWGDQWSGARANTNDERGEWVTAPVGCYPDGTSAYGAYDLVGNVWEWTASEYASYPDAAAPFYEPGSYTLRGSSCVSLPSNTRCTYRSRLPAWHWRYHLGFRVVLARPLQE